MISNESPLSLNLGATFAFILLFTFGKCHVVGQTKPLLTSLTPVEDVAAVPTVSLTPAQQVVLQGKFPGFIAQLATDTGIHLVPIPAGTFMMGEPNSNIPLSQLTSHGMDLRNATGSERPQTQVTLTKDFFLGSTDVTQGQYEALMGNNPSFFKPAMYNNVGRNAPVESVTWYEALAFCKKLDERERVAGRIPAGYAFTLPTEAQWEYACRAGTTSDSANSLEATAWIAENSGGKKRPGGQYVGGTTHPVGTKRPNAWGLYDMLGNVSQWCADWIGNYSGGAVSDPTGPDSGFFPSRVYRGGNWDLLAADCHSSTRTFNGPESRNRVVGFRIALSSVQPAVVSSSGEVSR